MSKITPFLWFNDNAEQAMTFYCSLFENSAIQDVTRYGGGSPGEPERAMIVTARIAGQQVRALNGGPDHQLSEAFSFVIDCEDQAEVDRYWEALTADGGEPGPCGWLRDRFGLSWQVIPRALAELMSDPDPDRAGRVTQAMLRMSKIDVAALCRAYEGD
ncbi:MAG TPA: VOC family protein [Thermomicrobiales bacterium]|nr:VOC family protein [Thermomicrobiales bacterium]